MTGAASPLVDGRLEWYSTFAALIAAFPNPAFPVGTQAYTTDMGSVRWSGPGGAWQMDNAIDGLAANSGTVQAGATPITASMARFSTVGGAGYSSLLPASAKGMNIVVTNAGANSMNVFPNAGGTGTEQINALAANAAFALGAGKTVSFLCYTPGIWHTWPLVP